MCGSFFLFINFYFATGEGELLVFTRRNDASQPRIHPTPPQWNRLFGKKKPGVGESHTVHFILLAPNKFIIIILFFLQSLYSMHTRYLRHNAR